MYQETPSFYNDKAFFDDFLGNTSYYAGLQKAIYKIVGFTGAKTILELGCALGTTIHLLASKYGDCKFVGVDNRADIIEQANKNRYVYESFRVEDMRETVKAALDFDLVYMLYSFHHIEDPVTEKQRFLCDCYDNMKEGSYLVIGETFLPKEPGDNAIKELWRMRSMEGYASTFWGKLQGLSTDDIMSAINAAHVSRKEERHAGDLVLNREGEYLITREELEEMLHTVGFKIALSTPVNALGDHITVAQKVSE